MEIEQRMRAGGRLSKAGLERLEQHSPVIDGELGITFWKGHFRMNRYKASICLKYETYMGEVHERQKEGGPLI